MSTQTPAPAAVTAVPSKPRYERAWPLWGAAAGLLGFVATVLTDTRPESELIAADKGELFIVDPSVMDELTRMPNYIGFLIGFAAVAALVVFQAAWRATVERRFGGSTGARIVSGGILVSAAGLALAYGWKGALANYGYDGPEAGLYGDDGLFVYFMLTDFGAYIPWLGVLIAAGGFAWMAWRERLISRGLGTVSGIYAIFIAAAFVVTGVPGLAGPLSGLWLLIASIWLSVGRSAATRTSVAA